MTLHVSSLDKRFCSRDYTTLKESFYLGLILYMALPFAQVSNVCGEYKTLPPTRFPRILTDDCTISRKFSFWALSLAHEDDGKLFSTIYNGVRTVPFHVTLDDEWRYRGEDDYQHQNESSMGSFQVLWVGSGFWVFGLGWGRWVWFDPYPTWHRNMLYTELCFSTLT